MPQNIELQPIPNQSFSVLLDGNRYQIRVNDLGESVAFTISRDEVDIVTGFRAVAGTLILPYEHLESGNFIFLTENNEIPEYEKFGVSQTFHYLTAAEMESLRAS